ncbi:MAG: LD-carboxypeptidase [Paludibacter sp.]|nr:LD-carboxypeptidase [Paludibacter sp.]
MLLPFLKNNDEVRFVSPAGNIDGLLINNAAKVLCQWGLRVSEGKFVRESYGRFAGTEEQRIFDLQNALDDENVRAIFCSRGGYGLMQIIDKIDFSRFKQNPKWIVGFSDVTVLHSAVTHFDIASVHSSMAKNIGEQPNSLSVVNLKNILFGKITEYNIENHELNRFGQAHGKIIGGNLSVLLGLRGTCFEPDFSGKILLIEDIGEQPYHIDRMLQNLRLGDVFASLSGLLVGQFTEYEEDLLMLKTVYELISDAVSEYDFPVCFNFPAGHTDNNFPVIFGKQSVLSINEDGVKLKF